MFAMKLDKMVNGWMDETYKKVKFLCWHVACILLGTYMWKMSIIFEVHMSILEGMKVNWLGK